MLPGSTMGLVWYTDKSDPDTGPPRKVLQSSHGCINMIKGGGERVMPKTVATEGGI